MHPYSPAIRPAAERLESALMARPAGRPLLCVEGLTVAFGSSAPVLQDFSLTLDGEEMVALVGESGSGKTTAALAVMGLIRSPGRILRGRLMYDGRDLTSLPAAEWRRLRGKELALLFQEPSMALNPLLSIGAQLTEGLLAHGRMSRRAAWEQALEVLVDLEMDQPEQCLRLYPHQLSGGMQQRVLLAGALLLQPSILIADEPTSAVDAVTQIVVLDRLQDLRTRHGTGILLITHDLAVASLADRVVVLHQGRTVEAGADILRRPKHPYTARLVELHARMLTGGGEEEADLS